MEKILLHNQNAIVWLLEIIAMVLSNEEERVFQCSNREAGTDLCEQIHKNDVQRACWKQDSLLLHAAISQTKRNIKKTNNNALNKENKGE